jgi:hypothetical protein
MADPFATLASGLDDPARNAFDVAPDDAADLATVPRALWIGTEGDLKVDMVGSGTVTLKNLFVGYHPLMVKRVYATGTTARDIVGLY